MKVKDFVSESNWCQRALALTKSGEKVNWPYATSVVRWCFTGMILYCYREDHIQQSILSKVKQHLIDSGRESDGNIGRWNDRAERTWEDVLQLTQELDI